MKNNPSFWPTKQIDMVIARNIIDAFAELNIGKFPFAENNLWDGVAHPDYSLPVWMLALIEVLKKIHGQDYFVFPLENIIGELADDWLNSGISETAIDNFKQAVRRAMENPEKALH